MEQEQEQGRLDFVHREVVLRASFDELDDDGCLWTPVRFMAGGPRHPRVGESVFLIDRGGAGSLAEVVEINGWMARVRLQPGAQA